jgi:hypothetical protein
MHPKLINTGLLLIDLLLLDVVFIELPPEKYRFGD